MLDDMGAIVMHNSRVPKEIYEYQHLHTLVCARNVSSCYQIL